MRDRLIEILKNFTTDDCRITHECGYCDFGDLVVCASAVAEHLLAAGVIVPPCKVGDAVFQTDGVRIYPLIVERVIYDTAHIAFDERAIGRSIFLTREGAEQALKEAQG